MALDGIVTRAIVHELQGIRGGRINKIHQPNDRDIVLNLRAQGGSVKLLLSANPTFPRVHFTEQSFLNPTEAPMFCMLLRKHCEGGVIEKITQVGMERIIHMDVRQRDELGDVSLKRIIIELMGRHSNIILLDPETGVMLDGIHHVTPSISSYRVIMPGFQYTEPPEQNKLNPLETEEAAFISSYQTALEAGEAPKRWIVNTFTGLSPLIAEEILTRVTNEVSGDSDRSLWSTFSHIMDDVRNHRFQPVSGLNAQDKVIFSAIPLTLIQGERKEYATISECMEDFFGEKAERDTVKQKVSDLLRFLQNERSKNVKKLDYLQQDLAEAEDADQFRIYGELLFASLHEVKKGDKEVTIINFYDEEQRPMSIPLDPLLNPSDNAQRYFKKYNKYKNSLAVIDEQLEKTHEEIRYMDSLLQQLAHASMNDIEEIREELVQQGYLRDRVKKERKRRKTTVQPCTSIHHPKVSSYWLAKTTCKMNM